MLAGLQILAFFSRRGVHRLHRFALRRRLADPACRVGRAHRSGARRAAFVLGPNLCCSSCCRRFWEVLVQQTINGLTRGAVFALIALGYTMVYGIIELINFAHGDVFMLGLFISLAWFSLLGVTKALTGWGLVTLLPLVFVLTMLMHGRAQRRDRSRGLSAAAAIHPPRPADHGHRRVLHARELALLWKGPARSPIRLFPSVDILRDVVRRWTPRSS